MLLVQREVAERVVSAPGSEAYGALSANVQAIARPEIVGHVPAGAFTPRPSVESAILRPSFRNWDHPFRRQIFSGVRLAWDVADAGGFA